MSLPIDLELLKKREEIPEKLAALSYINKEQAIVLLRNWGEKKVSISILHGELTNFLKTR